MLCFTFFVYFGEETGFAGWISSYVVMEGLDTEKGASRYPAIFWISITLFRFLFAGMPGKISTKLKTLILIQIFAFAFTILMINMGFQLFAMYWSSVVVGFAYSSMYALFYTLPLEFNHKITESESASFLTGGALG